LEKMPNSSQSMQAIERCLAVRKVAYDPNCTQTNRATPFNPRPDDVIIVGHRKSGTTWMQQIVHQIRTKGDESFKRIFDVVPFVPDHRVVTCSDLDADQVTNPRVFKSHDIYEDVPKIEDSTRFIVTIRDPYDAEWSQVKYVWRIFGDDRDMSPEEYEAIMALDTDNDFASFIKSWWAQRDNPNVLLLPYEEMKRDLKGSIQKVAQFVLGEPLGEADLAKVLYLCSFEYMARNDEKFNVHELLSFWSKLAEIEQLPVTISNVRVDGGQIGQGKQRLHETMHRHIDKRWNEAIKHTFGIESYEELYKIYKQYSLNCAAEL